MAPTDLSVWLSLAIEGVALSILHSIRGMSIDHDVNFATPTSG